MATDEKTLVSELKLAYESKALVAFWRKLHGSRFSSGLPDVVVGAPDVAAMVEFKWIMVESAVFKAPAKVAIVNALTQQQKMELMMLDAINGPLRPRIVIGMPFEIDELPGGEGVVALGADFGTWLNVGQPLGDLASMLLQGRLTGSMGSMPKGVEGQLRCRGEAWRAGPIVLGLRRYKVKMKFEEGDYDESAEDNV